MHLKGKLLCASRTDTGRVREHNEDAIASDGDIGLIVLADGMGGYNAGEVASGIAIKTIAHLVREAVAREDLRISDPVSGLSRASIILRDAILRANKIIYQTARTQPHCEGMGTTVVGILFFNNSASVAHVGDSRAYRLRHNRLEQITIDHSLLQELVDRGYYTPEEAQHATNKNYVTRALGVEPTVDVEIKEYAAQKGDVFMLCSDGLTDMLEDDDIELTINTFGTSLDSVGNHLVQQANEAGGRDNISVVLAQVAESFPARTGIMERILKWFS
jgi:protein phosphatase